MMIEIRGSRMQDLQEAVRSKTLSYSPDVWWQDNKP